MISLAIQPLQWPRSSPKCHILVCNQPESPPALPPWHYPCRINPFCKPRFLFKGATQCPIKSTFSYATDFAVIMQSTENGSHKWHGREEFWIFPHICSKTFSPQQIPQPGLLPAQNRCRDSGSRSPPPLPPRGKHCSPPKTPRRRMNIKYSV